MISVRKFMHRRHHRFEMLLGNYLIALRVHSTGADRCLAALAEAVEQLLLAEERVIFPLIGRRLSGNAGGPAGLLRADHRRIRRALLALFVARGLLEADVAAADLHAALREHGDDDELAVAPWLDGVLTPSQRRQLCRDLGHPPEIPQFQTDRRAAS